MAALGLVCLISNHSYSQDKKKLIRVIEVDDKGEHLVKEINVANNDIKVDSITHDVQRKLEIEHIKIDSLQKILQKHMPNHFYFGQFPDMPDFDFNIQEPPIPEFDQQFEMSGSNSEDFSPKMYFSEKGFDKTGDLTKILEDLENGTFDPQKWNMKEVEKDKIKDFKTKGKGEVFVINSQVPHQNIYRISRSASPRDHRMVRTVRAPRMVYYNINESDSLDDKGMKTITINASRDSDDENVEKVIVHSSKGRKPRHVSWSENTEDEKDIKTVVMVTDGRTTKLNFTHPSDEEMKMLEKAGFAKEGKDKLHIDQMLTLKPKTSNGVYKINLEEKESGKAKVIIADDKGKTLKVEEFDHSNGKTEKEVEIKDLKSGVYYIQIQLNGKAVTSKVEVIIN